MCVATRATGPKFRAGLFGPKDTARRHQPPGRNAGAKGFEKPKNCYHFRSRYLSGSTGITLLSGDLLTKVKNPSQ
jgi:hypothetical protein